MEAWWSIAVFFSRLWGQFCSSSGMHEMLYLLRCTQDQSLPTLCFVFLNSLLAMHNCRWKGKKNIVDNFSSVSARSINTFFILLFFLLKNNLRRINFTVTEVKYCHPRLETLMLAAHLQVLFRFPCLCFCLVRQKVEFRWKSACVMTHAALPCPVSAHSFMSLTLFFLLLHSFMLRNATALWTVKLVLHHPDWVHLMVVNVCRLLPGNQEVDILVLRACQQPI